MPKQPKKGQLAGRVRLDGDEDLARPELAIHVVGDDDILSSADIDKDGSFVLDEQVLAKARRVVVTAKGGDPFDRETAHMIRPAAMARVLELGELALPDHVWTRFLPRLRCVDATLRRCFPWRFVFDDLVTQVRRLPVQSLPVAAKVVRPILPFRCAPVCEGSVEVYRRRCCCPPWRPPVIVEEPPFELPPHIDPREPIPPFPPDPPVPPGPGPDPAPFGDLDRLLTGGAIDTTKLMRLHFGVERELELRPFPRDLIFPPLCSCGPAVKVADGFVGEGGAIHVCWLEPLWLRPRHCHDEYAFVVKQSIAGSTVTIYDGVAAGQWFDEGEEAHLTSYHPRAIGCREDEFPVPVGSPFVVLQDIGSTESHRLRTPLPDSADSVAAPAPGSGLLDVDGGPHYALGGDLQLRYHFSEIAGASMKALGARFYRVQWAPANAAGDPDGTWETLPVPEWKTWKVVGTDIVPSGHSLATGAPAGLFHIPYDTGAPLDAGEEWQDGQFHAVVPTAAKAEGRYLVRIEVFDGAGVRMEPATSAFTFRRWDTPTTTVPVAFGALTHLIRTDNRAVVADLVDILGPGAGAGDCKFFEGGLGDVVTIQYRAFHPEPGSPSFMHSYGLTVNRGVSGTLATPALSSTAEVGEGGPPAAHAVTIGDLLDGEDRCSFAVRLHVAARIHNGGGRLSHLDRSDIAAFAVLTS
jgi:hypothetical protein